jgi:hypothetical protein
MGEPINILWQVALGTMPIHNIGSPKKERIYMVKMGGASRRQNYPQLFGFESAQ